MPIRETIGLAKDSVVQGLLVNIQTPTPPPPDPTDIFVRGSWDFKTRAHWWNTDEEYVGDITHPYYSEDWTAAELAYIAKKSGSDWIFWSGPGVMGYYTPANPAPGTTPATVPVGSVGNGFVPVHLDPDYTFTVISGDQLAVVAFSSENYFNDGFGVPSDQCIISIPSVELRFKIYANDGVTLLHDFGDITEDLSAHNPLYGEYPDPGFVLNPTDHFYLSSIWTVP